MYATEQREKNIRQLAKVEAEERGLKTDLVETFLDILDEPLLTWEYVSEIRGEGDIQRVW